MSTSLPFKNFAFDGDLLFEWLGSFWTRVFENKDLARNYQAGNSILAAQLYLNFLENLDILDRHDVPTLHRERWYPLIIRKSEQNTGNAALLRVNMDPPPQIGKQDPGAYLQDEVFKIGGAAEFTNVVSYPLGEDVKHVATCITDNILSPQTILVSGTHFIVRDGTLFFMNNTDPFITGTFPTRQTVNDAGEEDTEILLWLCDTLIDKDVIYEHLGYVLGVTAKSTEFYKKMLNAVWDLYNEGTPLSLLYTAIGAILGEPTVISPQEVVELILTKEDRIQVITDLHVYDVAPDAVLRVAVGDTVRFGQFLTEGVRIYDTLDPMKLAATSEYGVRLKTDVPSLFLSPDLFRADIGNGLIANWTVTDLVADGVDANGNPRLRFELLGNPEDVEAFWEDFWAYLEANNISSETCFSAYLDATITPGQPPVYGRVAPLEYFFRYYMKHNTFIIVLERDRLTNFDDREDNVGLLSLLSDVIPAHILMLVVEQLHVTPEEYSLEDDASDDTVTQALAISTASAGTEGPPSTIELTYKDRSPKTRWIPVCD